MRKLELLAPAKDLRTAVDAIDCGADAVYIGAGKFGARHSATNAVEDIANVAKYAVSHLCMHHSWRLRLTQWHRKSFLHLPKSNQLSILSLNRYSWAGTEDPVVMPWQKEGKISRVI